MKHAALGITLALATITVPAPTAARPPSEAPTRIRSTQPQCFSEKFAARVAQGVAGYADVADIPGISIGVVTSDTLAFTGDAGYANRTKGKVTSPDTLYNIASVTKLFTAMLALRMADEGLVDLDAPVANHLPEDVHMPRDATDGAVTVRHLLTHSSGLPRNPPKRASLDADAPRDAGVWDAYKIADLYAALPATTLKSNVGEKVEYSNFGYGLLGHILERAGGQPFETLLRQRILEPLGMSDTAITVTPAQADRVAAFYWSKDPDRREQHARARYGEVAAHGGLTSNVSDLAAFMVAAMPRPDVHPTRKRPASELMSTPQLVVQKSARYKIEMALGWFRKTDLENGAVTLFHVGEVDGHTAGLFIEPKLRIGVIVLQNLGGDVGSRGVEQLGTWLLAAASDAVSTTPSCAGTSPRWSQ